MIHTPETLPKMRRACKLAANILAEVEDIIQPGVTTDTIDAFVHNATISAGAYPSPLNYGKFPKSVCTSVNECVCHGIPDTRPLQEGDILNVDVTVFLDGFHGDTSRMFKVGKIHPVSERLIQQSMEATMAGIKVCAPGVPIPAIGKAVHDYCDAHELQTCAELVGHGVGSDFHVNPPIFHVRAHKLMPQDQVMHVNQTFTVEPAIMLGGNGIRILEDNWSMLAEDGCYAAQHEHTILITETGYEILTIPDPPEVRKKKIKSRKVQ